MSGTGDARPRIGLLLAGFDGWAGGLDFVRILLNGLLVEPSAPVPLLIPEPTWRHRARSFPRAAVRMAKAVLNGGIRGEPATGFSPDVVARTFADFGDRVVAVRFPNHRRGLIRALRASNVDVVLPAITSLGRDFPVPWAGYIFDFQHRHLPQFFDPKDRAARDAAFRRMLDDASVVIVNAARVRADAEEQFPGSSRKIIALPFAPSPRPEWLDLDVAAVLRRYDVVGPYLIVCNQFWVHKDHETAIRGFASLLERTSDSQVSLICTGGLHDYRAPGYVDRLRTLMRQLGIEGRVRLLGHIAKSDQIALVRGALAVVQPTLYEGGPGGGAVYDAVALGVPALVSDIPVNREIVGGDCRFFSTGDHEGLAERMEEVLRNPPGRASDEALLAAAHVRLLALHEALQDAAVRTLLPRSSGTVGVPDSALVQ